MLKFKKEEARIKKEGEKIGIEKGLKKGAELKALEMATAMKKKGYDLKEIADVSKLSISTIRKL